MSLANAAVSAPTLDDLDHRLQARGIQPLDAAGFEAFAAGPGDTVVLFAEDPAKVGETWDVAVVLPEVLKDLGRGLRTAYLPPQAARQVQPRYGFSVWPALVFLRDGGYVGAIEGMRDWGDYQREIAAMLDKPVSRPPTVGLPVRANGSTCH